MSTVRIGVAAALALVPCALLFPIPQPAVHVNQPFKIEFLLAAALLIFLGTNIRSYREIFALKDRVARAVAAAIAAFTLWSLVSYIWAGSAGSVAHHGLLWSVYALIFCLTSGLAARDNGIRFPATVFSLIAVVLGIVCISDFFGTPDFSATEGVLRIRYGKYAELLVTILPVVSACALYVKAWRRRALILSAAALGWITVMLSLSKGAFIAGLIGFVLFFVATYCFAKRGLSQAGSCHRGWLDPHNACNAVSFFRGHVDTVHVGLYSRRGGSNAQHGHDACLYLANCGSNDNRPSANRRRCGQFRTCSERRPKQISRHTS